MRQLRVVAALTVATATAPAAADRWLAVDVPAAVPVSHAQAETFRPGVLPALGLYGAVVPALAVGVRARAGVLADGAGAMPGRADPGPGGLGTLSLALRLRGARPWLELAGGGGVTGTDVVPTLEVGVGWSAALGAIEVGPAVRYLYVRAPAGSTLGSAQLVLAGLELRRRPARPRRVAAATALPRPTPPPVPPPAPPPRAERDGERLVDAVPGCAADATGCHPVDADGDRLTDALDSCEALAAMAGAAAIDAGCGAAGDVTVERDRIILAERVLFKVNRARVRRAARPILRTIAAAWARGAWAHIVVEGHADVRGDAAWNQWLSEQRAERARAALIAAGVPADAIDAIGYGATRPRSATDHDTNRRVEFVIVPRGATP